MKKITVFFLMVVLLDLTACSKKNVKPVIAKPAPPTACACPATATSSPVQLPDSRPMDSKPADVKEIKVADYSLLKPAKWEEVDGFTQDDLSQAWPAWMQ